MGNGSSSDGYSTYSNVDLVSFLGWNKIRSDLVLAVVVITMSFLNERMNEWLIRI